MGEEGELVKVGATMPRRKEPMRRTVRRVVWPGVFVALGVAAAACEGDGDKSFGGSNDPGKNADVISGKSDTAGVSAGTALQPPTPAPAR